MLEDGDPEEVDDRGRKNGFFFGRYFWLILKYNGIMFVAEVEPEDRRLDVNVTLEREFDVEDRRLRMNSSSESNDKKFT